jgi:glycosyltransferase involved in cell wall biosynthesis
MPKITWIKITSKRYGGAIYGEKARKALSNNYDVEVKNISSGRFAWRYLKPFGWLLELFSLKGYSDLWVRDDFYSIALQMFDKTKGKKLAVIYHIDSSTFPLFLRPAVSFLEILFYWQLKKSDAILTIADFWKKHFLKKGYKNVYKISPCLDLSDFDISDDEVREFKKEHDLEGKPIVYLGNCQRAKGVVESYEALKGLDVHFVTSGEERVKIPVKNLNLDYREYLKLLKASSIVITMSKFKEGWNITAHEAMLLKTPVIGSGLGGMKELLEGGKQIICQDFRSLREKVEYLLNNHEARKEMGEAGYQFAKNFTRENFKEDWLNLVRNLLK